MSEDRGQLAQAACGLEYLHSLGIVHGGVSPVSLEKVLSWNHALISVLSSGTSLLTTAVLHAWVVSGLQVSSLIQ